MVFRFLSVATFVTSLATLGFSIDVWKQPRVSIRPVPMLTTLNSFCAPLGDDAWSRWDASCRIGR